MTITMRVNETTKHPANWAAHIVADILPKHWHRIVPKSWVVNLKSSKIAVRPIPSNATPAQIAAVMRDAVGPGVTIKSATDHKGHKVMFGGDR